MEFFIFDKLWAEGYVELCQTSQIGVFLKSIKQPLAVKLYLQKRSFIDVWEGRKYASAECATMKLYMLTLNIYLPTWRIFNPFNDNIYTIKKPTSLLVAEIKCLAST